MIEGHRQKRLWLAAFGALVLLAGAGCSTLTARRPQAPPIGLGDADRDEPDGPAAAPRAQNPRPTEVAEEEDEEELNRGRRDWFESLHRAAPGTSWRAIEAATWQRHLAARNARRRAALTAAALVPDLPPWIEVGSFGLAGRTHQVALHTATHRLYLGSNRGGLWRGDFDPANPAPDSMGWTPLSDGVFGGAYQVLVLEGPPVTLLKTYPQDFSSEIHRSTDGGATWTLPSGVTGRVRRLLSLQNAEETVFAITDSPNQWVCGTATTTKLLRSRDRGATFQVVRDLGGSRADIWTARTALGPLYVLTDNRLEVSSNLGDTWTVVGTLPWTGPSRVSLTASEAGGPTFYAVVQKNDCSGSWTMFASPDGVSWVAKGDVGDFWGDMVSLTASTTDPNLVLYGGTELWRSTDGAASFTKVNAWSDYYGDPGQKLHADIPWIGFVPTPSGEVLFVSTDGGTFYSLDGGATVKNISLRGLNVSQYYSTLSDASDPRRLHAGSQDQGYQTGEAGLGEAFEQIYSGDYGHLTSSSGDLGLVYSAYPGFILVAESTGSGTVLHTAGFPAEDHHWLPCLLADPLRASSFYFCAQHLYKYTRSGSSWLPKQLPFDFGAGSGDYVSAFAIAPSNTKRWYVATTQGRLWYSINAGASWIESIFTAVPAPQYLTGVAIVVDPADPLRVYVGGSGYSNPSVYRSTDGGQTFSPFSAGLPSTLVYALAADPLGGADVYAATESGPYRYDSSAGAWQSLLGDSAPMTTYWSVERAFDRVRFGTYGRGIWDYVPAQGGCTFTISPPGAIFDNGGGTGTLSVATQAGCHWTATRLDPWLTLMGATMGTASGSVPYAVTANTTGLERSGHVAIQGQALTVVQTDAPPTLSIGDATVTEGDGGVTDAAFTVTLSQATAWAVTVQYATANGSATAPGDFAAASGTVTFAPSEATQTIHVAVNGDALLEGDETFAVNLSGAAGAIIGDGQGLGTIVNDDAMPSVSIGDAFVAEGDVGTRTAALLVTLSAASGLPTSVAYATADGSAASGFDYTTTAGTLTIPAGSVSGTISVAVKGDVVVEANETFVVNLSSPVNATIADSQGQVTIGNDDAPGQASFSAASYSAGEAAGFATIVVNRLPGKAAGATVAYATVDGTATSTGPGADFVPASGTLTFAASQTSATFKVPINKDAIDEGDETVVLRLDPATGPTAMALGAQSTAVLTLTDDDAGGKVQFSSAGYSVVESAGSVTLTVKRSGGLAGGVTVQYATADVSAGAGDYTGTSSGDVSFAQSGVAATTQTITIPIAQDPLAEGAETFTVTLSSPTGGAALGTPAIATVTILDDEATLEFSAASYTAKETQPSALVTVKRSGLATGVVTVEYAAGGGTATPDVDYRAVSGTLAFPSGVTTRTFAVPMIKDALVEGPETVDLTLTNPGGTVLGGRDTATLTIVDDDAAPTLQFSALSYTVSEGMPRATIGVKRTGAPSHQVSVEYVVLGSSTATPVADYDPAAASGSLTFDPGVLVQTIQIPIVNDLDDEGTETVDLHLQNPQNLTDPGHALLGAPADSTLRITDNETTVQFSAAAYAVSEAVKSLTVSVKRTGDLTATTMVQYDVVGGTASRDAGTGGDYRLNNVADGLPGTLTFAPGQAVKTFTVNPNADTASEGDETLDLQLSGATNARLGTPAAAVVTIKDNDVAGAIQFGMTSYSVRESAGTARITVTRTGGTSSLATVGYSTSDGSAVAGTDYTATSGTLTFDFNEKSRTFDVPVADDGAPDTGAVSVTLTLDAPGGGLALGPTSAATLWIVRE